MELMRVWIVIGILAFCFVGSATLFWYQEYRYSLPTPVPAGYKAVPVGQVVENNQLPAGPKFLHFYNPDCPCSRFNAKHVKMLIHQYRDSAHLLIVVPATADLQGAREEFGDHLQYVVDEHQALAKAFGVYSTPQAVLVDGANKLYYRGNYNAARYCTSRATNYAELALIALLNDQPPPVFDLFATQAYGCELNRENKGAINLY